MTQIQLATAIASMYSDLGMTRKFAFFVREAALLSRAIVLPHKAHALLRLTAPHYQLTLPTPNASAAAPTAAPVLTAASIYSPYS